MASCTRPSERASSNVSSSCSGLTPATGMIRSTVPTKFEVVGVGDSVGGKGVPIATGDVGGRSSAGTTGVIRKVIATQTSATMTRNTTESKIRSLRAAMAHVQSIDVPKAGEMFHATAQRRKEKTQRRLMKYFASSLRLCVFFAPLRGTRPSVQARVEAAAVGLFLRRTSSRRRVDGDAMSAGATCITRSALDALTLRQMLCLRSGRLLVQCRD